MTDGDRIEIGDLVEVESGAIYPVVATEQGGRTVKLPHAPEGMTSEYFREEVDLYEKDPAPYQVFMSGLDAAMIDHEKAEAVATLIQEDCIKLEAIPVLFRILGEDVAAKVGEKLE